MYNWPPKPFILAHRGARSLAPENTLAAFTKAFELGADGFECDVFLSKDGVPVILHDKTLDRTTNGRGYVWNYDAQTLRTFGVPTLEDALKIMPEKSVINIELKGCQPYSPEYLAASVSKLIEPYKNKISVIISSFDSQLLEAWKDMPIGLLFESRQDIKIPENWQPHSLNIKHRRLKHAPTGFKIILWTAKNLKTAKAWLTSGVAGVIAEF
jgi:glycerophosphoryl diester phosphodiesterase